MTVNSDANARNIAPIGRLRAIDATRGSAMLFVFLSHFMDVCALGNQDKTYRSLLHTVGMLATPTFLVVSGLTLGYLFQSRKDKLAILKSKLVDRGLFFILVGHALITIAYNNIQGPFLHAIKAVHITDTIGICLICAPSLMERFSAWTRLMAGIVGYVFSWGAVFFWNPVSVSQTILKESFFGAIPEGSLLWFSFPIVPWFCLYLCCTVAGEGIFVLLQEGERSRAEEFIRRIGVASLISSLTIIAAIKTGKLLKGNYSFSLGWLTIYQKSPPGPTYILFFGGVGICLLYILMLYGELPLFRPYMNLTEVLGKTSFFVFILQYFVFQVFTYSLHIQHISFWPLYLLLSTIVIVITAKVWLHYGCNRFISLKYVISQFRASVLMLGRGRSL